MIILMWIITVGMASTIIYCVMQLTEKGMPCAMHNNIKTQHSALKLMVVMLKYEEIRK